MVTPRIKRKPQTEEQLRSPRSTVIAWWEGITNHPSFFDIIEAAKRKMKHQPHAIQDTPHGQHFAAGYCGGFEDALRAITEISEKEIAVLTTPETTYVNELDEDQK